MRTTISKRLLVCGIVSAVLPFSILTYSVAGEKCRTNSPYYFSEFNPSSWKLENELNYEEVYKNFEYYEVIFNMTCDVITVKRYKKNQLDSSETYRLNPDGSLNKKSAN